MSRRTTRWYRRNEEVIMSALGFNPTINSGAGWIEKEDGQNDYLIAQLKSTDAESIRIHKQDIRILEHNAAVAHKVPCFVIQFIDTDDVFIMARPSDLQEVSAYITTGACQLPPDEFNIVEGKDHKVINKNPVKSSSEGRNDFWESKRKEDEKWKSTHKRK